MSVAVLLFRTQADAVGERRFEAIEIGSPDIHVLIGDQSRQVLPHALAHDARLTMMHVEAFFEQNGGDVRRESLYTPLKYITAGKREILGATRVCGAGGRRQAGQAAIHAGGEN